MKKYLLSVFVILLISFSVQAQHEFRVSMGINGISSSSLRNYINNNFASSQQQIAAFNTAISFSGEYGYLLKPDFQLGVEYDMMLNSFTIPYQTGDYEISYTIQAPSILAYYVLAGPGYKLKIGGGAGPRFASVGEKIPPLRDIVTYTSTGFGVLAKAEGLTTLGGNFYAYIGGDLRLDFAGDPKKNGISISDKVNTEKVTMTSISAGLKLGISYSL